MRKYGNLARNRGFFEFVDKVQKGPFKDNIAEINSKIENSLN